MSTKHTPREHMLLKAAEADKVGGAPYPYVSLIAKRLEGEGMVEVSGDGPCRVRCTPEGLEAAREIQEGEDK